VKREDKATVIEEVAAEIKAADAVFAVDYRGISVKQIAELRERLRPVGASFRVVKNRLTKRAADQTGAESLNELLEGPTAFTFVRGDAASAAKALATFRKQTQLLEFKGGTMNGAAISVAEMESIARLPARELLQAQFVGVLASPITGLVRGLGSLISGLASQLKQIEQQGLVTGSVPTASAAAPEPGLPTQPAAEAAADPPRPPAADIDPGSSTEPGPDAGADQPEPVAIEAEQQAPEAAEPEEEESSEPVAIEAEQQAPEAAEPEAEESSAGQPPEAEHETDPDTEPKET